MSAPVNLDKRKPKKDPYWKFVGWLVAVIIVIIVTAIIYAHNHHSTNLPPKTLPTALSHQPPVMSTTAPTPRCPQHEAQHDGFGEDVGRSFCFNSKEWTIYQNMVNGKQKTADGQFAAAFKATGMTSNADRQGFAVDYQCNGTIYDENAAEAAFSGVPALKLLHGTPAPATFITLRRKLCVGIPQPTMLPTTPPAPSFSPSAPPFE